MNLQARKQVEGRGAVFYAHFTEPHVGQDRNT